MASRFLAHLQNKLVMAPMGLVCLLISGASISLAGCGAPGEPVPPSPPLPAAILDLTALQAGDGIQLNFTVPGKSVTGDRLKELPTMEVLRGSLAADGTPDAESFRVVETVPGAMLGSYSEKGKAHLLHPVTAEEVRQTSGQSFIYRVRARVSDKKVSANSNDVTVKVYPVAAPIETLQATVTEQGIALGWTAPVRTSGGDPVLAIEEYHIYRGEVDAAPRNAGSGKESKPAASEMRLRQIAIAKTPGYQDSEITFGKTYVYSVRSVLGGASGEVESGSSRELILTPQDTFPPAAPRSVVAAVLPGVTSGKFVVDLSWSINVEPDFAGYRVYRSEQQGTRGVALNADLLPTPAYRDESVENGKRYFYTVTALDRAGNQSSPSDPSAVLIAPVAP